MSQRILITGANGFVGRALTSSVLMLADVGTVVLFDKVLNSHQVSGRVQTVEGDLKDGGGLQDIMASGIDTVFHLAALPGGASEADYNASRSINLDATLNLIEMASTANPKCRFVYSSTIAVLGAPTVAMVEDETPLRPAITYGCHKQMVEIALADFHRRGCISAVSLRLPGIVARPAGGAGLKSAFMSDIFHALKNGSPFVCPTEPGAAVWAQSLQVCVRNLLHAASVAGDMLPEGRAITLPALQFTMEELAIALCRYFNQPMDLVSFAPDYDLQAKFATLPPLVTTAADRAGFIHDGNLLGLIKAVFSTSAMTAAS